MGAIIGKLLGLVGGSGFNAASGLANHTAALTVAVWVWRHWGETLQFSASVGSVAVAAGVVYVVLEAGRRSEPGR